MDWSVLHYSPARSWSSLLHSPATLGCHECNPSHLYISCNSSSETAVETKTPKDNPGTKAHSHVPVLPLQLKKWIQVRHNRRGNTRKGKQQENCSRRNIRQRYWPCFKLAQAISIPLYSWRVLQAENVHEMLETRPAEMILFQQHLAASS